jgi:hypothetical protein
MGEMLRASFIPIPEKRIYQTDGSLALAITPPGERGESGAASLRQHETEFADYVLRNTPSRFSEDLSSEIHETNRISDPYIFLINRPRGKLQTPDGQDLEGFMDKTGYLGRLESNAFDQIQSWSIKSNSGRVLWFSPPHRDRSPASKIIVSEIKELNAEFGMLINRAILLDISSLELLRFANQLSPSMAALDPESLRGTAIFPSQEEYDEWFQQIEHIDVQFRQVSSGSDISRKITTYQRVSEIDNSNIYHDYGRMYREAQGSNLIGQHIGSCPSIKKDQDSDYSPFSIFSESLNSLGETKTLDCECPFCYKKVTATIANGKISCPECKEGVSYKC